MSKTNTISDITASYILVSEGDTKEITKLSTYLQAVIMFTKGLVVRQHMGTWARQSRKASLEMPFNLGWRCEEQRECLSQKEEHGRKP